MSALLWLQFAFAVWQFIRVAKFFRIPWAFAYHTSRWLIRSNCPKPFSKITFSVIQQGRKWTYPSPFLAQGDTQLPSHRYFLQRRYGSLYMTDLETVNYMYILDRHQPRSLCSKADLVLPDFYILDEYSGAEGIHRFLEEGSRIATVSSARVLILSSREHALNQNFTRLVSILPLMLQARGYDSISLYASLVILVMDQLLNYPANLLWTVFKKLWIDWCRFFISRFASLNTRLFVSSFMATLSPKLKISDQIFRNFYWVSSKERVPLFGTSCMDHFHDDIEEQVLLDGVNPFLLLSLEDYSSLAKVQDMEGFDIQVGELHLEHRVSGACIKTFLKTDAYYNFIDNQHLHYGGYRPERELDVRKALKFLEAQGKLPLKCDHEGELSAVSFNTFMDNYMEGTIVTARLKKGHWVS